MQRLARVRNAETQLQLYEQQSARWKHPEQWKIDHDEAMLLFDFEGVLASAVSVLELINRTDEEWRIKLYKGLVKNDPDFDKAITALYERWLKCCNTVLASLAYFESRGYEVAGAAEFRSACQEVKGILTPDEKFFSGDAITKLRDAAIDSHLEGKTTRVPNLSD